MNQALHAFADASTAGNLLHHWHALLEHIPIGVYLCDSDGAITGFNAAAAALWGAAPDLDARYCGAACRYDTGGRPLAAADTAVGLALASGSPAQACEMIIERSDGTRRVVRACADPLRDETGILIGVVNCLQDITPAGAPGDNSRRMLEAIVETTPECIKVVAADGTLLEMNAAGCAMLGAPSADLVGRCIFDVVAPEHRAHWREHHRRVCLGEHLAWEFDVIGSDGARRNMETRAAPLTLPDGALAHLAVTRDVTARKRQERELDRHRNQLQELLEAIPAAVYTTDPDGTVTFFNKACADIAGRAPRVGADKWCVTWKLMRPDGTPVPHDDCPMAVALRENRPVRGEELVVERPDGSRVPIIPHPTPLCDGDGRLIGAINMLVDISERKHAEYRQRMLLDELNHRVKNNLQMLYSLLRAAQRESESVEAKDVLEHAAHRVGAIAAAQRVLYGADSATRFDAGEFLQAVCGAARQGFASDVKIKVHADAGELSNEISMPLALILNELLTNAVKHGLKDRRHGSVRVQLGHDSGQCRLSVEDDGDGFELRPSSRRSSGLGLIEGLARQIGGTFAVERGAGARCVIGFPAHRAELR